MTLIWTLLCRSAKSDQWNWRHTKNSALCSALCRSSSTAPEVIPAPLRPELEIGPKRPKGPRNAKVWKHWITTVTRNSAIVLRYCKAIHLCAARGLNRHGLGELCVGWEMLRVVGCLWRLRLFISVTRAVLWPDRLYRLYRLYKRYRNAAGMQVWSRVKSCEVWHSLT